MNEDVVAEIRYLVGGVTEDLADSTTVDLGDFADTDLADGQTDDAGGCSAWLVGFATLMFVSILREITGEGDIGGDTSFSFFCGDSSFANIL